MVEYIGFCLSKDGFLGKDPVQVDEKVRAALHILVSEEWFDLNLEPKHVAREFLSHVRSTLLFGADLLSLEAKAPFLEIDEKLTHLFLLKLLKLGRNKLARKHQWRLQMALGIPPLARDIDKNIHNCIHTWVEKRRSGNRQFADRAKNSVQDILNLESTHPLRTSLRYFTPRVGEIQEYKLVAWDQLE